MRTVPPITAAQTEFLAAFAAWSGRSFDAFPSAAPPCNALGVVGEDRILAAVFAISAPPGADRALSHIAAIARLHLRWVKTHQIDRPTLAYVRINRLSTINVLSTWGEALRAAL